MKVLLEKDLDQSQVNKFIREEEKILNVFSKLTLFAHN